MTKDKNAKAYLRSGELARLSGLSANTLRHYERLGLLAKPPRSRNGYREYSATALDRVRLVQRALRVGFSLDELTRILKIRDSGGAPCREVRSLGERKLQEIEAQVSELIGLRDDLRSLLSEWDKMLAGGAQRKRAGLLEALATRVPVKGTASSRRAWKRPTQKTEKENSDAI